jgi:hypothetical protein
VKVSLQYQNESGARVDLSNDSDLKVLESISITGTRDVTIDRCPFIAFFL